MSAVLTSTVLTSTDLATTAEPGAEPLPLTETLLGLLVVGRMTGNVRQYNVMAELELDPVYPTDAVRVALAGLLAVQPALRLGLYELPEPHGRLCPPPAAADLPLTVIAAPEARFESVLDEARASVGGHDFTLSQPPLIRFQLVTGPGRSVLLLCVHHTVFDGFSIDSLVADLNSLLVQAVSGETSSEPELDIDALRLRRERALRRELAAQVSAAAAPGVTDAVQRWVEKLRSATDAPLYPRPGRPADTGFHGHRQEMHLDQATSEAVDRTCRSLGVSPFTFFSAVFGATVARHTGVPSAVLGTPVLSRRTLGSFELCGLFTTTLPLVLDIDWTASFADFVTETVAGQTAAVKRDSQVPWTAIVRTLQPSRESSRNAGFASMIAMQDSTDVTGGRPVRAVRELGNGTAKVDLWLGVTPVAGRWLLELETDVQLIPGPVADGVIGSLLQAITSATRDPGLPLAEIFQDGSREQTFATDGHWHQPPAGTLAGWLEQAVSGTGSPSVEDGDRHLDRAALDAQAGTAAAALTSLGVRRGDVVGLTTDRLSDTSVAMLAVLRAGAAYLPLDLSLPTERLAYMAAKADCHLVIGPGEVPGAKSVPLHELTAVPTTAEAGRAAAEPIDPIDPIEPNPVYVMFTSGSTGQPKGVLMGDGPLLNLTAWQVAALDLGPQTRFLQYAPLGFDVSFQEIVPTLVAGGTVVSREPADRRDLPAIAARVQDAEITHVYLPVAALRFFAQAATQAGLGLERLRYVCVSGEQLVLDSQTREFFAARPHLTLVNLYGPTETHAVTTEVFTGPGSWPSHAPIGRPITGVSAQIVDQTGQLAPVGVPGELMLGGRCPAEGYVNDPEQTAARFVPDPYGTGPSPVRYRTGDRVLRDEQDTLVFLGREDDQVKISGYRVELGEVEAAALELDSVRSAVAAVRGEGSDRHLLLFVVLENDKVLEDGETGTDNGQLDGIRSALAGVLPSYMTPRAVIAVDTVPKTANGKVDRRALLARAGELLAARDGAAALAAAPLDDPELAWLERLWGEHLGRERIDPDTSLFELGAHSLMVLSVIATIEHERAARVPLLDFFRRPTLRALAGLIEGTSR